MYLQSAVFTFICQENVNIRPIRSAGKQGTDLGGKPLVTGSKGKALIGKLPTCAANVRPKIFNTAFHDTRNSSKSKPPSQRYDDDVPSAQKTVSFYKSGSELLHNASMSFDCSSKIKGTSKNRKDPFRLQALIRPIVVRSHRGVLVAFKTNTLKSH